VAETKKKGLGRGLSHLFGEAEAAYRATEAPVATAAAPGNVLPIEFLRPGRYQPRRHFDEGALEELASSIRAHGLLQPILVRPIEGEKNTFEIVAGERRWRAAKKAGINELLARVVPMTDAQVVELQAVENDQREDLTPIEQSISYGHMRDHGFTVETIATKLGRSPSHVYSVLKLNDLCPEARALMLETNEETGQPVLHLSVAYELATLPHDLQAKALKDRWQLEGARRGIDYLRRHFVRDLSKVPWELDDSALVKGKPCSTCPNNTACRPLGLFDPKPTGKKPPTGMCTDLRCYEEKAEAQHLADAKDKELEALNLAQSKKLLDRGTLGLDEGGYVLATQPNHEDAQSRSWKQLFAGAEKKPAPVKAIDPRTLETIELYRRDELKELAREQDVKPKPRAPDAYTKLQQKRKEDRKKEKAKIERKAGELAALTPAVFERVGNLFAAALGQGVILRMLARQCLALYEWFENGADGERVNISELLGMPSTKIDAWIDKAKPSELLTFALFCAGGANDWNAVDGAPGLYELAKVLKIDTKAIARAQQANADAEEKANKAEPKKSKGGAK